MSQGVYYVAKYFGLGLVAGLAMTQLLAWVSAASTAECILGIIGIATLVIGMGGIVMRDIEKLAKFIGIVVLAVAASSCGSTMVSPGYVGVQVNSYGSDKGVSSYPLVTGRVWYNPFTTTVLEYPTFVQTTVWTHDTNEGHAINEEITFTNKDQMSIAVDVSVSYSLIAEKVPSFYVKFRTDDLDKFTHGFLRNITRDAFNESAGKYSIEEVMGDNSKFLKEVRSAVQSQVEPQGVHIDQFGLIGSPRPPQAVIEAINAKVQATQAATRIENELRQSEAEAKKTVARAEGAAKARIAEAEGEARANAVLAASLSDRIIEWQRLQIQQQQTNKWNGVLPTVTSSAPPLLMLGQK